MGEFIFKKLLQDCNALKDKEIVVSSAAVSFEEQGNGMYPPAKQTLMRHNIPFSAHRAHRITPSEAHEGKLILIMDSSNERLLSRIISESDLGKVHYLSEFASNEAAGKDIADPWFTGDFEKTYREIENACRGLLRYTQVNII